MNPLDVTKTELANYLCVEENMLPADSERMLKRAKELISQLVLRNVDIKNQNHIEAFKNAICAQIEYWLEMGESISITNDIRAVKLGSFSVDFASGSGSGSSITKQQISPRALNFLNSQRLMYRGVRLCKYQDS